jgi:citrate synthase
MTDQASAGESAKLTFGGNSLDLPILKGSTGPDVLDIRKLYAQGDVFTYDPGFTSTAACESAITFIDGDKGTLLHRGYPIDQLAQHSNFLEVCHLLLNGELPTAPEYETFERNITYHTMLHEQFDRFFAGFRRDAHRWPSWWERSARYRPSTTTARTSTIRSKDDLGAPDDRQDADNRGSGFQVLGRSAVRVPRNDHTYAANFLRMCFSVPAEDYVVNPVLERAMDRIFILHADPRAERVDLDRAAGGVVGRQSVRLHRGGDRLPLGPRARGRQ